MANSRIGTGVNLTDGATYDLLLVTYVDSYPQGNIKFKIGNTPRKITGIQKAAQQFMKVLTTSVGSDVLHPSVGTNFNSLVFNANIVGSDVDLYNDLNTAIQSAASQVITMTDDEDNDDSSVLSSVEILEMNVATEEVILAIGIYTAAGEYAVVSTPFPQTDLTLTA